MRTQLSAVAAALLVFATHSAFAEPSKENAIDGMDNPEARADILLNAMEQFTRSNKFEDAYDAATAAHRLHPTTRTACVAAAASQAVKRYTESTEYFIECIKRAVASDFKRRDPLMWKTIQGDYDTARSRVGAVRVHAPPLTHVFIGGKDKGFVDETRELFVEPDITHTIVGIGVVATMHTTVTLSRGETLDVYLKPDETLKIPPAEPVVRPALPPLPEVPALRPVAVLPAKEPPPRMENKSNGMRDLILISGAVAGMSLVTSALFTGMAISKHHHATADFANVGPGAEEACEGGSIPRESSGCAIPLERRSTANLFTGLAIGFGIAAVASGTTSIVLLVKSNQQPAQASPTARSAFPFLGVTVRSSF